MEVHNDSKYQDVIDLLSQIADMNEMIKIHGENKFMQDEFSNRRSGLVQELGKILKKFNIELEK